MIIIKKIISLKEYTTCSQCKGEESRIYQNQLEIVSKLEKQFSSVWTQCQVCQGSLHQTVLCER